MTSHAKNVSRSTARSYFDRERLRRSYRPVRVRVLFVGEAPPASGRFFYSANSGLYRAIRAAFVAAFPHNYDEDFLRRFQSLGCYLVDLCGRPVDRLQEKVRRSVCVAGETRLTKRLKQLHPEIVVVLLRSIAANVSRAAAKAKWSGIQVESPYPGRWYRNRLAFENQLVPLLRATFQ